jgi:pyrroline-5-carboxylate reductase
MPSLPASVGQGCTAICHGPAISPHDAAYAERLFLSTGPVVVETPEPMMDAFTALAGSGPAYVFYLAEALTKAARQQGFEPEAAAAIVRQTIIGAARLLEERDQPPQALREAVTSKGGTTAAACAKLDELGVMDAFNRAIAAGTARARELGAVAGGPPKA